MKFLSTLILSSVLATSMHAEEEKTHDITLQIQINCPVSDEFAAFAKSVPPAGHHVESFDEWKASFIASMHNLIDLVESEKVNNCGWGVNIEEHIDAPQVTELKE